MSRKPFGSLQFVNDVFISHGQSFSFNRAENISEVIIPLVGTVAYLHGKENEELISSEQVKLLSGEQQSAYTIHNFYEKETVNYLHLGFRNAGAHETNKPVHDLDLKKTNVLTPLDPLGAYMAGYIGVYNARAKEKYVLKNERNGVFIYVINGAFEAEDRLIEYRDGLTLWGKKEIQFESLSHNAIFMLMEIPLDEN